MHEPEYHQVFSAQSHPEGYFAASAICVVRIGLINRDWRAEFDAGTDRSKLWALQVSVSHTDWSNGGRGSISTGPWLAWRVGAPYYSVAGVEQRKLVAATDSISQNNKAKLKYFIGGKRI